MIDSILTILEKRFFGVCAWWGKYWGIEASKVRLSFIYLSFITLGSNLIVYLIMVFILENKEYFKFSRKKPTIWEIE
jgi:phage shock protein PspC (stress-responsive transcriptional regulator)